MCVYILDGEGGILYAVLTMTKMKPPKQVSAYFRELQQKGVATRLAKTTPDERKKHAIAMNDARWAKARAKRNAKPISAAQ